MNYLAQNTTDVYDLKKRIWEKGPNMKNARASFASAVVNSTIFVFGETNKSLFFNSFLMFPRPIIAVCKECSIFVKKIWN